MRKKADNPKQPQTPSFVATFELEVDSAGFAQLEKRLNAYRASVQRDAGRSGQAVEAGDGGTWIVISVWEQVQVTSRPNLPLCAVQVEVFTAAGKARYSRPL